MPNIFSIGSTTISTTFLFNCMAFQNYGRSTFVVKKDNKTAHVQIVGDETLYGKDYIIEPENQAPLNSTSSKKKKWGQTMDEG